MWSYAELVEQAKAENLATIQTAVQHDCIVATTHEGMRFAALVADKAVPLLLIGERVSQCSEPCRPRAAHPSCLVLGFLPPCLPSLPGSLSAKRPGGAQRTGTKGQPSCA